MKKLRLADGNDNVIYLRGVVDEDDPIESDGSPKWINTATGTWTCYGTSNQVVASGTLSQIGAGGAYRIDLDDSIIYTDISYIVVLLTLPSNLVAEFTATVEVFTRTGATVLA